MASIYDFLPPGTREQAGYAGLGALAQALLQGGAPTTTPGAGISALGAGFGGFGQAYNSRLNSGLQQAAMGMQLAKTKREEEAEERYRAAITPQPIGPQYAMASGTGPGRVGPTVQAAANAQTEGNPLLASLPAPVRSVLPNLPMSAGVQLIGQALNRESDPSKRYTNVPGVGLVDLAAQGGPRPVVNSPKDAPAGFAWVDPADPTKGVRALPGYAEGLSKTEALKFNATLPGRMEVAAAGRPQTTVDMRQENQEAKEYGSDLVKEYASIRERATAAEEQRNQIRMARAFADTDATGKELPSVLQQKAGNAAVAMGFNVESPAFKSVLGNISNGQSFVGTMQNLVLTKMQAQKGPQTENDAKRIESTLANLGNTPEARDFLLRASDALAFEDVLKRQFYDDFRGKKMTFAGAGKGWTEFRNSVPFMGVSPNTGRPVFFAEFYEANRGKPPSEVIEAWRKQYGR
jgi:hypothetical protein